MPSVSGPSVKFQRFGPTQPHQNAVISTPCSALRRLISSADSSVHRVGSQLMSWQCLKPWDAALANFYAMPSFA